MFNAFHDLNPGCGRQYTWVQEPTKALKILQGLGGLYLASHRVLSSVKWAAFGTVLRGWVGEAKTRAMPHILLSGVW